MRSFHFRYRTRPYVWTVIALATVMAGTAVLSLSGFGASAVSSPMFAMSLITGQSFGTWFFIVNATYFVIQLLILRGKFPRVGWFQLLAAGISGVILNAWMALFTPVLEPHNYLMQWVFAVVGSAIVALGIALQTAANITYLPAEGLVQVIASLRGWKFSRLKLAFDVTSVALTAVLTVVFLDTFATVREATLISMVTIGPIIGLLSPLARRMVWGRGNT